MAIKIRKLKRTDLNALYRLGLEEWKGQRWLTRQFVKETMKPPGYDYVACDGKKVIGAILVEMFDRPKVWIFYFVVSKGYRGQGIGGQLLKMVEADCVKDFPLLFVDVGEDDIAGNNFYKKSGFKKQARIKDWFDIGEPGIIYSKRLV